MGIVGLVFVVALAGCGGRDQGGMLPSEDGGMPPVDGGQMPVEDAGEPMLPEACSELDPRSEPPEVFVGPYGVVDRLRAIFADAQTRLRIAIYMISDAQVVAALEETLARGVAVELLIDPDNDASYAISRLRPAGADIREASPMFEHYHPKYVIVDDAYVVVMSGNLNEYSMQTERNHNVVLRDPQDVADLAALFDLDFAGTPADLRCTRLVMSPNNSRDRIEALITSATTDLRIQHLSLSDRDVQRLLGEAAARGVNVRVILADPAWIESNTASAETLRSAGVLVKYFRRLDNHAKLIVADDRAAFVGSVNLSWTSLTQNREVGVVLTDEPSVTTLRDTWEQDWSSSSL